MRNNQEDNHTAVSTRHQISRASFSGRSNTGHKWRPHQCHATPQPHKHCVALPHLKNPHRQKAPGPSRGCFMWHPLGGRGRQRALDGSEVLRIRGGGAEPPHQGDPQHARHTFWTLGPIPFPGGSITGAFYRQPSMSGERKSKSNKHPFAKKKIKINS